MAAALASRRHPEPMQSTIVDDGGAPASSKAPRIDPEVLARHRQTHGTAFTQPPKPMEPRADKPKHAVICGAVPEAELATAFEQGVLPYYAEMQLPSYSRYEAWTQSSYITTHPKWTPQPPINQDMFKHLAHVQERCRRIFAQWYADLHGLEQLEVITLNAFVTKYVASEGKNHFGKHVDGAKVMGSLVLALPTNEENDWAGMLVWDGPRGRGPLGRDPRPEHHYVMQPGDALVLDRIVWHHGLPITRGARYVIVNFYEVKWIKLRGTEGL